LGIRSRNHDGTGTVAALFSLWRTLLISSALSFVALNNADPACAVAAAGIPIVRDAPIICQRIGDYRIPAADDRGYDVEHYDLDLIIDPQARSVAGAVNIRLRSLRAGLDELRLDLVDTLAVDSLSCNGAACMFLHTGDSLRVTLPTPLDAGDVGNVRVVYSGRPQRHGPFYAGLLFRLHGHDDDDPTTPEAPIVANVSEPYSAHSWWPCKDHPADKATARIAVTAPDTLTVISNGRLIATEPSAPGWRRTVWQETHPIATYLVSVAISNYETWTEICPGIAEPVTTQYFAFPEDRSDMASDLASTCDMLAFMEALAGPYPFTGEKYAQVEVRWGGAMENQTATALGNFVFTGDGRYAELFLHELSHHWFGNSLTPADWPDVWLNEGFARYCEALWVEHTQDAAAYREYMDHIVDPRFWPNLFVGAGILTDPPPLDPLDDLVYDKGAWVLHMLRGRMGDDAFFAFVHAYANDPVLARATVTTADLIAHASAAAGEDLAPFLAPWLYTDAVPVLDISVSSIPLLGRSRVRLSVAQQQQPCFPIVLPVRVITDQGRTDLRAHLDGCRGSFVWEVPGSNAQISIDPDRWLLYRAASAPAPLLQAGSPFPNPATAAGTQLPYRLLIDTQVTTAVYDVRGRRVGSWDLGFQTATGSAEDGGEPLIWSWDGELDGRRRAPAAVYWLELRAAGERIVRKITLIR